MGHTPLSLTAQKRNLSQKQEKAYAEAEAAYCSAAAKALTKNSSKPKLSTFTKTFPRIDHNTLHQHLNGGLTKQGSALKQGLLTETQSESLISFILEMAEKGFPLSYKKIKEYTLSILHTKDPTCCRWENNLIHNLPTRAQFGGSEHTIAASFHSTFILIYKTHQGHYWS